MASIHRGKPTKRFPEGRWEMVYRVRGKQRTKTFDTYADAKAHRAIVEAQLIKREWIDPDKGKVTLAVWYDQWVKTRKGRITTQVRNESYVRNHILPTFGNHSIGEIEQVDVAAWVAERSAHYAPATVRLAYQLLAKMLQAAVDGEYIVKSPCRSIELPKIERDEMRFLTPQQVALLADCIDPRYRAFVLVAAYGGLRRGELCGLRTQNVDLMKGTVRVVEQLIDTKGGIQFGPPKTKAAVRTVTLPRPVVDALTVHIANRPDPKNALVFQSPAGMGIRKDAYRKRFWLPAVERAGMVGLRIHDLRHTAISLWIEAGANVKHIAARAGHESVVTVLDVYGHLMPNKEEELQDQLTQMYVGATGEAKVVPIR